MKLFQCYIHEGVTIKGWEMILRNKIVQIAVFIHGHIIQATKVPSF